MKGHFKAFRIAIRKEGKYINAYYALPDSMDGALHLGSILRGLCDTSPELFEAFVMLMQGVAGAVSRDVLGVEVAAFTEEPAPEHERSGHA